VTWLLIILGVSALVLLGYLVGPFGSKFDLRPAVERLLVPESEEEARARYSGAWKRYRTLRIAFPLVVLGCRPVVYIGGAVLRFFGWNANFLRMPAPVWMAMGVLEMPWLREAVQVDRDLFFPKHCHCCKLPMCAESPDE
jgi:hypothetical protein